MSSLRSAGGIALARTGKTTREIASVCGVDHARVVRWISGELRPTATQRAVLAATYGIQETAWDEPPPKFVSPFATPKDATSEGDVEAPRPPPTTGELVERIARQAERSITEIESDPAVTPLERDKRLAALTTIVNRLRDDVITEKDIAESDAWKRIQSAIVAALKPFPGALDAVAKTLRSLEQ